MIKSGFLNVHKPAGLTSHQCVAAMRKVFDTRHVGHGGTLDPMATGVLTVAVGRATRFLQYLTTDKEYRGIIRLGITTDSDDSTGKVLSQISAPWINEKTVRLTLQGFIGEIEQVPPRISAIKRNGVRMYKLAREKRECNLSDFELKARRVQIKNIQLIKFVPGEYPEAEIHVVCGGGTYVRSIARECGEALFVPSEHLNSMFTLRNPAGECCVGGTLSKLVRTKSGAFSIVDSLGLEEIRFKIKSGEPMLQTIESMLQHLPYAQLQLQTVQHWLNGGAVTISVQDVKFVDYKISNTLSFQPIRIYQSSSPVLLGVAEAIFQAQHDKYILKKRLFI